LLGLLERSPRGTLGILEADYDKSAEDFFLEALSYMEGNAEWMDIPDDGSPGIGRPGIARAILSALTRLLELTDSDGEADRQALIEETFPWDRNHYKRDNGETQIGHMVSLHSATRHGLFRFTSMFNRLSSSLSSRTNNAAIQGTSRNNCN